MSPQSKRRHRSRCIRAYPKLEEIRLPEMEGSMDKNGNKLSDESEVPTELKLENTMDTSGMWFLQRAALTFEMVKLGLAPSRARDVVWEMEYDLQQIWGATVSNHYKAYAILIPNKQNKWLVFWCWTASKEENRATRARPYYTSRI